MQMSAQLIFPMMLVCACNNRFQWSFTPQLSLSSSSAQKTQKAHPPCWRQLSAWSALGGWPAGLLTEIFHCCTLDSKAACGWVANVTSWTGTMPLYCVTLYQGLYNSSRVNFKPFSHSPALEGRSTLLAYKSNKSTRAAGRTGFFSDRRESIGRGWVGVERGKVERKKEASQWRMAMNVEWHTYLFSSKTHRVFFRQTSQ